MNNTGDREKQVVIYGIGTMSKIVYTMACHEQTLSVAAFTADAEYCTGDTFMDLPLVDFNSVESAYPPDEYNMLAIIGYRNMRNRKGMFEKVKTRGYSMPNVIGRQVNCTGDPVIGENNLIFSGTYLGLFGSIGDNNIIRPNTYLGHNTVIGSHNYIAPGCNIGGNCAVGDLCFIGIGATVIDGIRIGDETQLGPASLTLKDTEPCSFYAGNPAKKIREHRDTGIIIER
jgi:UDP-N-acetylbacillosamine N-acetyltransferase